MIPDLPTTWKTYLATEIKKPYWLDLQRALKLGYKKRTIFPPAANIFTALEHTALQDVKVIILGQDPYHGEDQANGLSFSVQNGQKIPPSLRNIYKEIVSDTGGSTPESGNLEHWAKQGVLLLNSTLTVEANEAGSHQGWGWELFTDEIIRVVSAEQEQVVFLLWGKFAQAKKELIDDSKHLILKAAHPSPLAAHRGFFGCKHFSKANEYLIQTNQTPINWNRQ